MRTTFNADDEIIFKLLHYFITDKGYNPVILHGAKDEIWLENLDGDYKIVRLVSNYIHNDEQLGMDLFRTNRVMKAIKKKTLSLNVPVLSIFLNTGDNVHLSENQIGNITCVIGKEINDLTNNEIINDKFPDLEKKTTFKEKGFELFAKLTQDINSKTANDATRADDVFKPKKPIVTYTLIVVNIVVFLLMYILGNGSNDIETLVNFGANQRMLVRLGDYYRLITSGFIHIGIMHLFFNCSALYVIGRQVENFFGKTKFLIIYLGSMITGNLLSICFSNYLSAGASGAIFGLLGALLYFGYHYRLYLGSVLKNEIIPLILFNLALGFILNGVDNAAHIGGLIGGVLLSIACGVKYKSTKFERINGFIMTAIYLGVIIYLGMIGL